MRVSQYSAALVLTCALSACGTAPSHGNLPRFVYPGANPYWMNQFWQTELFTAVQSVVHLPTAAGFAPKSEPHGTVRFLYDNGAIRDPVIVESTGSPEMDKLLLQQVITAKIPKPFGRNIDQPHEFQVSLKHIR